MSVKLQESPQVTNWYHCRQIKVNNVVISARSTKKTNQFLCDVIFDSEGYTIYPYDSDPDIYVKFDITGEFLYQNKTKNKTDKSVQWCIAF